jgi:hypothetical protein
VGLDGGLPAEDFPWPVVEFGRDLVEFGLTVAGQVGRFRKVLAE